MSANAVQPAASRVAPPKRLEGDLQTQPRAARRPEALGAAPRLPPFLQGVCGNPGDLQTLGRGPAAPPPRGEGRGPAPPLRPPAAPRAPQSKQTLPTFLLMASPGGHQLGGQPRRNSETLIFFSIPPGGVGRERHVRSHRASPARCAPPPPAVLRSWT